MGRGKRSHATICASDRAAVGAVGGPGRTEVYPLDRRVDLALAVSVMILGALVLIISLNTSVPPRVIDPLGPRFVPSFLGAVFAVGGGVIAARTLLRRELHGSAEGEPDEVGVPASGSSAMATMGLSVLYMLAIPTVGYIFGTLLFVPAALWLMKVRRMRTIVATSMVYTAATYALFAYVAGVDLPLGPLAELVGVFGLPR